jgi:SprT protein
MQPGLIEKLSEVFDKNAANEIASILISNNLRLIISRPRKSKHGYFRPSSNGSDHKISINSTLGKDSALLVFLHELSHLIVWQKYGRKVAPHGNEWKSIFSVYIQNFVSKGYFSLNLKGDLLAFSRNIKASGLGSDELARKLGMENQAQRKSNGGIFVEDLPENSIFIALNGRLFQKERLLRKRYLCQCLTTKRKYTFHPQAEVIPKKSDI